MFSQPAVAGTIDRDFEAAWQSVRPVPLVTVDFGEGRRVTRTLHGNVATYVLAPDGLVVDVIPGLYSPAAYLQRLGEARRLALELARVAPLHRGLALARYHARRAALAPAAPAFPSAMGQAAGVREAALVDADTTINESSRRARAEQLLARSGATGPERITSAVYREVLGVNLDDPLLGLGAALGPDPLADP